MLETELAATGISWATLKARASQIVLFGSRASNDASQDSDWDLLIVSDSADRERNYKGLDLIWVTTAQIRTKDWLGSELANHIAQYGVWLHGVDTWSHAVFVSDQSVETKKAKIRKACEELLKVHKQLEAPFITRRIDSIRRDLQRLAIMMGRGSVPPTPVLDRQWTESTDRVSFLSTALALAQVEPCQPVLRLVEPAAKRKGPYRSKRSS